MASKPRNYVAWMIACSVKMVVLKLDTNAGRCLFVYQLSGCVNWRQLSNLSGVWPVETMQPLVAAYLPLPFVIFEA